MKQHKKLNSEHKQQQQAEQRSQQQHGPREFASAEELLRHDAAQTRVPPGIAERLAKSAGGIPGPKRSWWQRLFGS